MNLTEDCLLFFPFYQYLYRINMTLTKGGIFLQYLQSMRTKCWLLQITCNCLHAHISSLLILSVRKRAMCQDHSMLVWLQWKRHKSTEAIRCVKVFVKVIYCTMWYEGVAFCACRFNLALSMLNFLLWVLMLLFLRDNFLFNCHHKGRLTAI